MKAKPTALASPSIMASAASGAAPRLFCIEAHDPGFLDRAIEGMRGGGAGPEASIVGDALAMWWRTQKPARTARRDEALLALDKTYVGSGRDRAKAAARDQCLYAATGWKRDQRLDAPPL